MISTCGSTQIRKDIDNGSILVSRTKSLVHWSLTFIGLKKFILFFNVGWDLITAAENKEGIGNLEEKKLSIIHKNSLMDKNLTKVLS